MMNSANNSQFKNERGTVMIEGVFGVLVSIIVMAFLLSFSFYIYQQTMVDIVANEIAEEVVMTYKFRDVDDCADISLSDVQNVGRYRYFLFAGQYDSANEAKGTTLANVRLSKTSLAQSNSAPKVEIEKVGDDLGRMHYEVTLTQNYEFMMGDILSLVGIADAETLSTTVYVEAVDVSNYINTVKMTNYGLKKFTGAVPLLNTVNSVIKLMKSVYNIFT